MTWREAVARMHGASRASLLRPPLVTHARFGTVSVHAAFRRVTEGSELRDGLLEAITPRTATGATPLAE